MCVNVNTVQRSWTLLAAFGGSYAPGITIAVQLISVNIIIYYLLSYLLCIILCRRVSRDTYNSRGMSNMQLNDGPHGAWVGVCRTSSASACT